MKVLVIGSGGREHALAWKIRQSPQVTEVVVIPGNGGTTGIGRNVRLKLTDLSEIRSFAQNEGVGLTVVGPDDVLAAGIVDVFQSAGLRIFGPSRNAARLESSKSFAKRFMVRHGIPTARFAHHFGHPKSPSESITASVRERAVRPNRRQSVHPLAAH